MESKKYNISNPNIIISEEEFDELVEFNLDIVCNIIPYDDPDYICKTRTLAAILTEISLDPSFK